MNGDYFQICIDVHSIVKHWQNYVNPQDGTRNKASADCSWKLKFYFINIKLPDFIFHKLQSHLQVIKLKTVKTKNKTS